MPSATLWLGCYVTTRPRGDGTYRVLFEVPKRLRPPGWSSQIQLPRQGKRTGDLTDAVEVSHIQEDARALKAALDAARKGDAAAMPAAETRKGSIPWLIVKWGGSRLLAAVRGEISAREVALEPGLAATPKAPDGAREDWLVIEPGTRATNIRLLRHIYAWSITMEHKHVRSMLPANLRDFLNRFNATPRQRRGVREVFSQLFAIAKEEHEITMSPLDAVKTPRQKRIKGGRRQGAVERWVASEVDGYANVARSVAAWRAGRGGQATPWRGGAIMVRLMWETSADSTDTIVWTKRDHFVDDEKMPGIEFDRGKTGVPTFIPISQSLAVEIRANGSLYLVTDPQGQPYDGFADDSRLRRHMKTLRKYAVAADLPSRVFDHLRHSAATHAKECGVAEDNIRHLTAHATSDMNRETYIQRSRPITIEIQRARGIIP